MRIPELNGIIKFISVMYNPDDIDVSSRKIMSPDPTKDETVIRLTFNTISDDYITNPDSNDIKKNKEKNLERVIRKDVEGYFSIKTSGLSIEGFAPYVYRGLTIDVMCLDL